MVLGIVFCAHNGSVIQEKSEGAIYFIKESELHALLEMPSKTRSGANSFDEKKK